MSRFVLPRLILAVLAALVLSLLAAPSQAAPSTYKVTIKLSATSVTAGTSVKISGKVSPKAAGKKVKIQARSNPTGAWKTVKSVKIAKNGKYSSTVKHNSAWTGQYRVFKAKKGKVKAGASKAVQLTVWKKATLSQQNARRAAENYLKYMPFSRSGLIDQLEFEGYSTADATYAVDVLKVNWYKQAELKAADYLKYMPFSRQGLIDQLLFEGFTPSEAEYGVSKVGL